MKLLIVALGLLLGSSLQAQDFAKHLTEARTAYTGGKLEDARFAMQQMMHELDIITGKEVLTLLPQKLDTLSANIPHDEVTGASGFTGVVIHRDYGKAIAQDGSEDKVSLEVITNSPLLGALNGLLALPILGNNPDQKVVKINGYKALVTKVSSTGEKDAFEVQLPLNNSLITLKAPGYNQDKIVAMANTIPVAAIAKAIQ
ncbi:hypothetical protein SAMN05444008_10443 [Cnuella takakiae]|uniref:DUF3887 domain-containing protein n=1 Tax=Cnuella takakiae TaxID=1302690 RepID=A0A1M4XUM8_9BACT|nr:hypothetical protein [Cnuella takakiae]OLY92947.1 hypothetical protein BUE76_14395 [Cnuella takakiae]SHE97046.1 hypothetical protein SAMN05444008_10443 [Cnuella takakiae]